MPSTLVDREDDSSAAQQDSIVPATQARDIALLSARVSSFSQHGQLIVHVFAVQCVKMHETAFL